jgi:hypothetical protein
MCQSVQGVRVSAYIWYVYYVCGSNTNSLIGPLKTNDSDCVQNMRIILREKYFYGFLSKSESEHLLTNQSNQSPTIYSRMTLTHS